jgi:hypothetical protein
MKKAYLFAFLLHKFTVFFLINQLTSTLIGQHNELVTNLQSEQLESYLKIVTHRLKASHSPFLILYKGKTLL